MYHTWLIDLADLKKFKQLPFSKVPLEGGGNGAK